VLEYLARVACLTSLIDPAAERPAAHLVDKHFRRKHGKDAYYGQ
jgi:ribulose-5-phosphate 4-epimerase/fuculose-1-phosphate aldolase